MKCNFYKFTAEKALNAVKDVAEAKCDVLFHIIGDLKNERFALMM